MSFTIRPAVRGANGLTIGLAGPSRSGKTMSALRLGTGLGGPIVLIDTESGRGLQYAEMFDYQYLPLEAPFTSERYLEAIEFAKEKGARTIIVDSASHEHEGPGGMLERHESELQRLAGGDAKKRDRMTFTAWIRPKAAHNKYVNRLLQLGVDCHFIFCFRAHEKLKIVAGQDPRPMGWTPICSSRFEYEMSMLLVLPEGSEGRPDLQALQSGLRAPFGDFVKAGQQIDEALGERLAQWARGAVPKKNAPPPEPEPEPEELSDPAPDEDWAAVEWKTLSASQVDQLERLMEGSGVTAAMMCKAVSDRTHRSVQRLTEIPADFYLVAVGWLQKRAAKK